MLELSVLADYAEIVGAASVLAAIVFAVIQLRQIRRQREELASLELMRSFQTKEFIRSLRIMQNLPDAIDPDDLRSQSEEHEDLAFVAGLTLESIGVMVARGIIPISMVDELMGGATRVIWKKLEPWVHEWRNQRNPRAYEWFEWLVGELDRHSDLDTSSVARRKGL